MILAILPCHGRIARTIDRIAFANIRQLLKEFAAVAVLGPHQFGKQRWQAQKLILQQGSG
jgi:hypothetical protein